MNHPTRDEQPGATERPPCARAPAVAPRSSLTLDATLSPWDGLLAAFASVLAYAAAQVSRAADDPAKAVHEYRKSIRRARAVVRLVRPLLKEKRYRRLDGALRQAVLDTSFLRDAEVLGDTIQELPRGEALDAAAAALRQAITAQQAAACTPAAIADVLARGAERLALMPMRLAKALPTRLDQAALADALRVSYRRARRRRRDALRGRHDDLIHGWRKRTKELRYQLELLEPAPQPQERALGLVAKELGGITDLIVLRDAVNAHADALGATHSDLLASTLERLILSRFDEVAAAATSVFEPGPRAYARAALAPPSPSSAGDDAAPPAPTTRPLGGALACGPGRPAPHVAPPMPPAPTPAFARPAPAMPCGRPITPATRAPRVR